MSLVSLKFEKKKKKIVNLEVCSGAPRGSVARCATRNLEAPGSRCTGPSEFFRGSVFGQDTSEPLPSTGETQEINEFMCSSCDMTEIVLKAA